MRIADAHICKQGIFVHVASGIVNSTRTFAHHFHGRLFRMLSAYRLQFKGYILKKRGQLAIKVFVSNLSYRKKLCKHLFSAC